MVDIDAILLYHPYMTRKSGAAGLPGATKNAMRKHNSAKWLALPAPARRALLLGDSLARQLSGANKNNNTIVDANSLKREFYGVGRITSKKGKF